MSEIKGQLFGIILVITVFSVVGTLLVNAFQKSAEKVSDKISKEYEWVQNDENSPESGGHYQTTNGYENSSNIVEELLTF